MFNLMGNRRAAVVLARLLLVCSLFAIGLGPAARANEYQYTITFDPLNLSGLSMGVMFDAASLPGTFGLAIDPGSVQILNAPDPGSTVSSVSVFGDFVSVELRSETCPGGCDGIPGYLDHRTVGDASLLNPIAGPGTYQFGPSSDQQTVYSTLSEFVVGGGPGTGPVNLEGSVTIVVTPEPNTGLMFGSCFLLCAAGALRRKIRRPAANYP
jgi:hypothetical protein